MAYAILLLVVYFILNAAIQVHLSRKRDAVRRLNRRMGR